MTRLFLLVDPLREESGKVIRLMGVQIMAAIQHQVVDSAILVRQLASQLMEFVIPLATHISNRQLARHEPGGEIRLLAERSGAQHGGDALTVVAKAAGDLAGSSRIVKIGKHPLPVPICQHVSQRLTLEALRPLFIVLDAGGPFTGR